MAKEKKTTRELTPEEKLARALVPVEEQPYGVPENWCWTTVSKVSTVITGGTPSKKFPEYYGGEFPFFKPADLDTGRHVFEASEYLSNRGKESARIIPAHSTAVCCIGSIGKSGYLEIEGATNQQINSAIPHFNPLYQYYFMNTEFFVNQLWAKSSATTISIVNKAKMEACYFPLPPLAEQQRIVDRIENLFAKLDEAKEKAQAVVDGFELRRSAILHKAFTGELTEKWRQTYGKKNSDWHMVCFDEVAEIKSNLVNPADYQDSPHIAPDNIEKKTGILLEYHTIAEDGVKSGNHRFYAGQILYSKIRPYLSKVITVDFDGLCSADMYPINAKEYTRYLWYYMLADEFLVQASNAGSRSVLPKINQKELSKIMVHMTSLEEQQEIVTILDNIFEQEQQAKEAAEAVLAQIDTMKKAILARAFRGELGTNDPEEESAEVLLRQII
ncbi:MAG: hypothetical protein HFI50_00400 [Lachnospiraceae bacterium]|nr:hypothetical protein [Lachnospiraceae bacterium]